MSFGLLVVCVICVCGFVWGVDVSRSMDKPGVIAGGVAGAFVFLFSTFVIGVLLVILYVLVFALFYFTP